MTTTKYGPCQNFYEDGIGCPLNDEETRVKYYYGLWLCDFCYGSAEKRGYHRSENEYDLPIAGLVRFFSKLQNVQKTERIGVILKRLEEAENKYFHMIENCQYWKEIAEYWKDEAQFYRKEAGNKKCESCRRHLI